MSQQIGVNFDVRIPTLGDDASIEEALKVYHYGIDNYTNQAIQLVPPLGIEAHFQVLTNDVAAINAELDTLPSLYIESISSSASENLIYSNAVGITPLKIKAITNQTAPLLTFQNAAGASVSEITTAGAFSGRALLAGDSTATTQAVNTNNTSLASTAFVLGQASATNPLMNNAVAVGTSFRYSREDHVHPVDTSRAPAAGSAAVNTLGTVTTGTWNASIVAGQYGGTGVANTGRTITLGGNVVTAAAFTTAGAFATTLTSTGATNVTLPTTGTLAVQGTGTSLSQFGTGSTTSTQLAGLISDKTGSGKAVFATTPSFNTSIVADTLTIDVFNTYSTTVNLGGVATAINLGDPSGTVTIRGNLVVQGSQTSSSTENVVSAANTYQLGIDATDNNQDRGILFKWNNGAATRLGFFGFDDSTGKFTFIPAATNTSDVMSGTKGTIDANLEWADILNKPDPVITLGGDLSGSVTLTDLASGTLTATIVANSVALGTDTTGNYTASVAGTANQVTVTGAVGEGQAAVLSLPQDIHTAANPTFAGATLDAVRIGVTATNEIDTTAGNLVLDSFTGTTQVDDDLSVTGSVTVTGNLTVNGTTSTINSTTISVDDKNIELGSVAVPTDITADGGGITLKGATDKTFNWIDATDAWTSSEHLNLLTGKEFRINGTAVLTATGLGSGVLSSSLTSVGTIATGVWNATTIAVGKGGTGLATTPTNGQLLIGNGTGYSLATIAQGTGVTVTNGAGTITVGLTASNVTVGTTAIALGSSSTSLAGLTGLTFSDATGVKTTLYTGYYDGIENNTYYFKSGGTAFRWYFAAPDNGVSDVMELTATTLTTPALTATTLTSNGTVSGTGLAGSLLSSANPLMNGTVGVGTSAIPSRQDHVHPIDTSRAPLASPALTGVPTAPTATLGTNTTQIATTAFVAAGLAALVTLPAQAGNAGKFLTTNATSASWATIQQSDVSGLATTISGLSTTYSPLNVAFTASATGYTLLPADNGKIVEMSGGGTLTISSAQTYLTGSQYVILQTTASQVTIAGSGVTVNGTPGLKLRAQWSSATLVKRTDGTWVAFGDLVA